MGDGARPLVFEAFKPIPRKGRNDRIHMRTSHLETASNALFVPPFVPHPDNGPARLIGLGKLGKGPQVECQLHGEGTAREEVFDGVVIGRIAEFPLYDAHDFAVMDGWIELLEREDMRRHGFRIDMSLPSRVDETLIYQSQHPCHGKAAGFRAHDGPLDARLTTAFGNGFRQEHHRPNHFISMLNIVDKVEFVLGKVLRSRHTNSPSARVSRRITASPHASF